MFRYGVVVIAIILCGYCCCGCGVAIMKASTLKAERSRSAQIAAEAETARGELQAAKTEAETARGELQAAKTEAETARIKEFEAIKRLHTERQIDKIKRRQEQMIREMAKVARREAEKNPWTEEKVIGILAECKFEKNEMLWPMWLKSWKAQYQIWDIVIQDAWTNTSTGRVFTRSVWIYPKGNSEYLWTKQIPQPFEEWGPEWAKIYNSLPK